MGILVFIFVDQDNGRSVCMRRLERQSSMRNIARLWQERYSPRNHLVHLLRRDRFVSCVIVITSLVIFFG
jgi:hypothetical protein